MLLKERLSTPGSNLWLQSHLLSFNNRIAVKSIWQHGNLSNGVINLDNTIAENKGNSLVRFLSKLCGIFFLNRMGAK